MGKRINPSTLAAESHHVTPVARNVRKRKGNNSISLAAVKPELHVNYDEDSSSNDASPPPVRNESNKHANNSSIILNSSLNRSETINNESPKPMFTLRPSLVNGTILYDLTQKPWRLGRPIGKGNFGEIFLASNNITVPVTNENANFVVKIEPHSNGPLFVEIHCLMNTAKKTINTDKVDGGAPTFPSGIPEYIASGSTYFGGARYRFLVLQRFDRDLHSLIKNCRIDQKSVLILALQIITVLENLHDKNYCHNDIKAQNLMISKCKFYKQQQHVHPTINGNSKNVTVNMKMKYDEHEDKQQTTDSGNSSEQDGNDDDDDDKDFVVKVEVFHDDDDDEDFDDGVTTNSTNSNSMDVYETPVARERKRRGRNNVVEYSGSNPVRSCRRQKPNEIYDEMVKSHYLRPTKRISYSELFTEDGIPVKEAEDGCNVSSDDDSEEFLPLKIRRKATPRKSVPTCVQRRLTRRQEKLLGITSNQNNIKNGEYVEQKPYTNNYTSSVPNFVAVEEERLFLIDFGLASKYTYNSVHRPFVQDQRRAHDGTLEFTSRDAHMGAHSRRSDLECLGYNLIFWSQGYLPWKDAAHQQQQEQVHRAKELLMTDVREMLKQIYGKQVPKYLGEYLHHVNQLAYHERPDYTRLREIFEREYQQLGYTLSEMRLESREITRTCVPVKEEIENKNDIFDINKLQTGGRMRSISVGTPFHERTLSNRISPKNLRSKSDKKTLKKKKFSWADVLSQDPDQIARERAEKEYEREYEICEVQQPAKHRYEGKPTYAIIEILERLKLSGRYLHEPELTTNDEVDTAGTAEDVFGMDKDGQESEVTSFKDDSESDIAEPLKLQGSRQKQRKRTKVQRKKTNSTPNAKKTSPSKAKTPRNTRSRKRTSTKNFTTTIRHISPTKSIITTQPSKRSKSKRSNRKGKPLPASAAGEIDYNAPRYLEDKNFVFTEHKPSERRKRRCLFKTDADITEEDSNSNFSPDVRSLYNVWNKISSEKIYLKGGNTAAPKHKK